MYLKKNTHRFLEEWKEAGDGNEKSRIGKLGGDTGNRIWNL